MKTYQVVSGDSPAKIAAKFAQCPKCAPDLLGANPGKPAVTLPNGFRTFTSLQIGEVINLPDAWFDGRHDALPPEYFKRLPSHTGVGLADGNLPLGPFGQCLPNQVLNPLDGRCYDVSGIPGLHPLPSPDVYTINDTGGLFHPSRDFDGTPFPQLPGGGCAPGQALGNNGLCYRTAATAAADAAAMQKAAAWRHAKNPNGGHIETDIFMRGGAFNCPAGTVFEPISRLCIPANTSTFAPNGLLTTAPAPTAFRRHFFGVAADPLFPVPDDPLELSALNLSSVLNGDPNYCSSVAVNGSLVNQAVHDFKVEWNKANPGNPVPIGTGNYEHIVAAALVSVVGPTVARPGCPDRGGGVTPPGPQPTPPDPTKPATSNASTIGLALLAAAGVGGAVLLATKKKSRRR